MDVPQIIRGHRLKPRGRMCSGALVLLAGPLYICCQVLAAGDVYAAELMVESNITLEAEVVLSAFTSTTGIQVSDASGASHSVTLTSTELVAECLILAEVVSCSCAHGYVWSNQVCYNHSCCSGTTCPEDVSRLVPMCIAKVKVHISGSVLLSASSWDDSKETGLLSAFKTLNGFENLNVTDMSNDVVDFEAAVSVKFETSRLEVVLGGLETLFGAELHVATLGMVSMEAPDSAVCYMSSAALRCWFEEATDGAGWNMTNEERQFELNDGSEVKVDRSCSTDQHKSCVAVTLQNLTSIWAGTYLCGFSRGSIVHTATTELAVALLPDVITLKTSPLTVDCSLNPENVHVEVAASISISSDRFHVWWSYMGERRSDLFNQTDGHLLVYTFTVPVSCTKTLQAQSLSVTFQNVKDQKRSAGVEIPVIYAGEKFCPHEEVNGEMWPRTPDGGTVINRTCPAGRVGFKSRTCEDTSWQMVFSMCIDEELKKVRDAADNFLKGLGATQKMALDIFEGLKNSSASDWVSSDAVADIGASIEVLDVMARASENVVLWEEVFPDFVGAASNVLNKSWDGVNKSVLESMSSIYLQSLEGLVKNIRVNKSEGLNAQNLELRFCSGPACDVSVFDVGVKINKSAGIMKTVAVRNLTHKLRNNFGDSLPTGLLVSATLEGTNDTSVDISLDFPAEEDSGEASCVFWNATGRDWSDAGCAVRTTEGNSTRCECNHLTSFSVLMAKTDVSNDDLHIITQVGLGVSICSLLIFLVLESVVWSAVVKTNLSYFRHTALVNIAVFLLLADCSFFASTSPQTLSDNWCLVLTVCKHLFFLAMFSWMLCLSVMLVHQLIFVFTPLRKRVFLFLSSIIGYLCPIFMVGSSYVYYKYTDKSYHDSETCWLVFEGLLEGSIHAFLLPVGCITLTNLFSVIVVIVTLVKTSVPDGSRADDWETAKSILRVVFFLTPLFGVTWVIGFALFVLERDTTLFIIANYSFTILNSFQGLFILLTGCLAEPKVRQELVARMLNKSRGKGQSLNNSTLITDAKNK